MRRYGQGARDVGILVSQLIIFINGGWPYVRMAEEMGNSAKLPILYCSIRRKLR